MKRFICSGYWTDSNENFTDMVVADGEWNGIEDALDESIFFYTDGEPVLGAHSDFFILSAEFYDEIN